MIRKRPFDEINIKNNEKCINCDNSYTITDTQHGHTCCDKCGLINNYLIDDEGECNFNNNNIYTSDTTRYNITDDLLPKLSLSTRIVPCYGSKSYNQEFRIAKLNQWYAGDAIERAIRVDFDYINNLKGFSSQIIHTSKLLFKEFYIANHERSKEFSMKRDCLRGDSRRGLIGICIYFAAKIHGVHCTKEHIGKLIEVECVKIRKARPIFLNVLQDKITDIESWNLSISKICNTKDFIISYQQLLQVPEHIQKYAILFYKYLKPTRILATKQPQSIAALSLWVVLSYLKSGITLQDIISKCGISSATLKNSYKLIEPFLKETLLYTLTHYVCDQLNIHNAISVIKIFRLSYVINSLFTSSSSSLLLSSSSSSLSLSKSSSSNIKLQEIIALSVYVTIVLKNIPLQRPLTDIFIICGNVQEERLIRLWNSISQYRDDMLNKLLL